MRVTPSVDLRGNLSMVAENTSKLVINGSRRNSSWVALQGVILPGVSFPRRGHNQAWRPVPTPDAYGRVPSARHVISFAERRVAGTGKLPCRGGRGPQKNCHVQP